MEDATSRRRFLLQVVSTLGAGSVVLQACSRASAGEFVCTDTGGLSETDLSGRTNAAYLDRSKDPSRTCDRCQQFMSSGEGCGACKLVRGPIHPRGTCKVFSPKA